MTKQNTILIIFLLFFAAGCKEEYNLDLVGKEPQLVVDGLITNLKPPYLVRLSYSKPGTIDTLQDSESTTLRTDSVTPEKNATIIISDNYGTVDTLKPVTEYWEYTYYLDGTKDSSLTNYNTIDKGFYQTQKIQGVVGRTYYLQVLLSNGKKYTSQTYMPPVPKIDSAKYIFEKRGIKNETYMLPLLYFKNPEGRRNFYMFQMDWEPLGTSFRLGWKHLSSQIINSWKIWKLSILSDEFLLSYVNGLGVHDDFQFIENSTVKISINSLTEESYNYYKSVVQQTKNDGGAYSPAPASPKGNISNGALGLFTASAMSYIVTYVDENSNAVTKIIR